MVLPTGGRKPGIPGQSRNELTDRILGLGSAIEPIQSLTEGQIVQGSPSGPERVPHRAHTAVTVATTDTPAWMRRMADYGEGEWQQAIDEVEAAGPSMSPDIHLLPGTHVLTDEIEWESCNIIGTGGLVAHGVRVQWGGAAGATVITKTSGGAGKLYGVSFRGSTPGGNIPATWLDFRPDQVDKYTRLDEVHFQACSGPAIRVGNWYNLHWGHLRFDAWGTYAISFEPISGAALSSAEIDKITADTGFVSPNPKGLIYLDDPGVSNAGVFHLHEGRIELHAPFDSPGGLVHIKHSGATVNARIWGVKLSNIAFQDNLARNSTVFLYRETDNTTGRDTLILDNVRQLTALSSVLGGTWNTSRALPPVQPNYPLLIYGDDSPILDKLTIRGSAAAGEHPFNIRVGSETHDRIYVSNDGRIYYGPGNSAPDVSTYRSGSQTLRVNPNLAVTGSATIGGALDHDGSTVGFFGATPISKPTVTGSWSDGSAGESLAAALESLGLVTDDTTG